MEKNIASIVGKLKLASFEEIRSVLSAHLGSLRDETLNFHLRSMREKGALINLLPEENSAQIWGYVLGPECEASGDVEIENVILNCGISTRHNETVNWEAVSQRLFKELDEEAAKLKEDILSMRESPKKLEMRYFDLSLTYHAFHRFFYEKFGFEFSYPVVLDECKSYLSKLQF